MIARIRSGGTAPCVPTSAAARQPCRVIAFPVFDDYGENIDEWLSVVGASEPPERKVAGIVSSMRRVLRNIERVRNSTRHNNLATFLGHAARALEAGQWDGARYLLMTAR